MQLSLVVPSYNEEIVLPETAARLSALLAQLVRLERVAGESLAKSNPAIKGIRLSRNCGHQIALLAGLVTVPGDVVISVDADLQDDLAAIEPMLDAHAHGSEVVFGVRRKRDADTLTKRLTATWYYRLLARLGVETVFNHADYRLMGRRALSALAEYGEVNVFLRGIIPQLGFRTSIVYYDRLERFAGESKYPLKKMLSLAWKGVTSFTAVPLRAITVMGISIALISFGITLWALAMRTFTSSTIPGWASTVVPIYLLGGLQLFAIGLIGEYLAKTYMETKRRPRFFIQEFV